ncbi:hypothetical protein CDD79_11930 [Raoultella ornithinolytica]|nr:hypothetical protein BA196_15230 [Klebsiella pneumoniae]PJR09643.1 hypothetical protein CDD79_11930 [Raoultella ornithinolytica]PLL76616.1 hypothetical protein CWN76_18600 [Klebsiella quasipneumoniae]PLN71200.1 hypothetical protein CWN73_27750 [Klebsiella quasipneumoniae]PQH17536.1 hypothetical protein C5T95_29035 [Raoultella ornithinolytica]
MKLQVFNLEIHLMMILNQLMTLLLKKTKQLMIPLIRMIHYQIKLLVQQTLLLQLLANQLNENPYLEENNNGFIQKN